MSNTEYSRKIQLRIDERDKHELFLAVQDRIAFVSTQWEVMPPEQRRRSLSTLRSLLERLAD